MKLISSISLIAVIALLSACGGHDNSNEKSDSSAALNNADTTSILSQTSNQGEQDFINYAVPANTKEIIWLQAGIKTGHSKMLKEHAKMMLKDHKKLDSAVSSYLAAHTNLSAPAVDTTNTMDITMKPGSQWDSAWTLKMVEDHSNLLDKLQNSQNQVKDTSLLTLINNTIPIVQSHLAMVKSLQTKMK